MNSINLRVFLLLFIALLLFSSVNAAPPKNYFGGMKYSKYLLRLNNGYSAKYKITVKPIKINFESNTAVNIKITIKNDSEKDIYLESDLVRIRGIEIKIRDSKGNLSEMLDKWKKKYGDPKVGSRMAIQILPGEEYSYQLDLRQFYKLLPEIYEISVIHPIIINEIDKKTGEKKEIRLKAKLIKLVIG